MSNDTDVNIQIEHLLAGAIVANGGELTFGIDTILSDEIVGKQFSLSVEDGIATITLVDPEKEEE